MDKFKFYLTLFIDMWSKLQTFLQEFSGIEIAERFWSKGEYFYGIILGFVCLFSYAICGAFNGYRKRAVVAYEKDQYKVLVRSTGLFGRGHDLCVVCRNTGESPRRPHRVAWSESRNMGDRRRVLFRYIYYRAY